MNSNLKWFKYTKIVSDFTNLNVNETKQMNYIDSLKWMMVKLHFDKNNK